MTLSPDDVHDRIGTIGRTDDFDVAVLGQSDVAAPGDYEAAGATWWLENVHDRRGTLDEMRSLVRRGPR